MISLANSRPFADIRDKTTKKACLEYGAQAGLHMTQVTKVVVEEALTKLAEVFAEASQLDTIVMAADRVTQVTNSLNK